MGVPGDKRRASVLSIDINGSEEVNDASRDDGEDIGFMMPLNVGV